jgi:hypothetical protein
MNAVELLANLPVVDPSTVWDCEAEPDVDACLVIDGNGSVACFRIDGAFAVPVQPSCAVDAPESIDAGNGMCSSMIADIDPPEGWCCESFGGSEPVCWLADGPEQCSGLSEWCPAVDWAPQCP